MQWAGWSCNPLSTRLRKSSYCRDAQIAPHCRTRSLVANTGSDRCAVQSFRETAQRRRSDLVYCVRETCAPKAAAIRNHSSLSTAGVLRVQPVEREACGHRSAIAPVGYTVSRWAKMSDRVWVREARETGVPTEVGIGYAAGLLYLACHLMPHAYPYVDYKCYFHGHHG